MKAPDDSIAISEIGEVGICERRIYLRKKYGPRTNKQREERLDRGTKMHELAYQQATPEQRRVDKRCFIATAVYGEDAPETEHLRGIRDRFLVKTAAGRLLVRVYYRVSPGIAQRCDKSERAKLFAKALLDAIVKATR